MNSHFSVNGRRQHLRAEGESGSSPLSRVAMGNSSSPVKSEKDYRSDSRDTKRVQLQIGVRSPLAFRPEGRIWSRTPLASIGPKHTGLKIPKPCPSYGEIKDI